MRPPARRTRPAAALMDEQLRTLLAVVEEGSFDGAAYALGISPSAVSQRVKALEARVGQVVVRRGAPATPTGAGAALVRMARQVELVEAQALDELTGTASATRLAVAVNADSLATWFAPVLADVAAMPATTLALFVEDEDHSARHLRDGDVVGAVTSQDSPVAGCAVVPLGTMRYLPVAAPALVARHRDLASTPVLAFNAVDDLQHRLLLRRGIDPHVPPTHTVPSSQGFLAAVRAGLGWGMLPQLQLGDDVERGRLVPLAPDLPDGGAVDVPLFWQSWRLESARLAQLTAAVRAAAAAALHPPAPAS